MRDADKDLNNIPGMPPEVPRASQGLRAAVDRMWRGMQRKREAVEKLDPTLFGRLNSADPTAIVERVARIEATLQALIEFARICAAGGTARNRPHQQTREARRAIN